MSVTTHNRSVDEPIDESGLPAKWLPVRELTVAIRPMTSALRNSCLELPAGARWAAVVYNSHSHAVVFATERHDGVGNLVTYARWVANQHGARFVEPEACCEYCGLPVDADLRWCPPVQHGRDCEALDRGSDNTGWRHEYPAVVAFDVAVAGARAAADAIRPPRAGRRAA